jgi:hypothetical protein
LFKHTFKSTTATKRTPWIYVEIWNWSHGYRWSNRIYSNYWLRRYASAEEVQELMD